MRFWQLKMSRINISTIGYLKITSVSKLASYLFPIIGFLLCTNVTLRSLLTYSKIFHGNISVMTHFVICYFEKYCVSIMKLTLLLSFEQPSSCA